MNMRIPPRPLALAAVVAASVSVVTPSPAVHAAPMTFVVDTLSDNPAAGVTLREAIAAANVNAGADTIEFAPGLTGTLTLATGQFDIQESVEIVGPGSRALTIDAVDASRVFFSFTPGTDLVLSGMTLTRGSTVGNGGAIIFHDGDDLLLTDVTITDSLASDGGAIHAQDLSGKVQLTQSSLVGNIADVGDGGGLNVVDAASGVLVHDSVVSQNTGDGVGGGIRMVGGSWFDLIDSTVQRNRATTGGGLYVIADFVQLSRSTIDRNQATAQNGGGFVRSMVTNLIVDRVTVSGNSSATGTAGLRLDAWSQNAAITRSTFTDNTGAFASALQAEAAHGFVRVLTSTFDGNTSTGESAAIGIHDADEALIVDTVVRDTTAVAGGAIYLEQVPNARIEDTTVTGTEVSLGDGGAVYSFNSTLRVTNSTFSGNTVGDDAGAIFTNGGTTGVVHSTIVGNAAGDAGGAFAWSNGGTVSVRHSIVAGNTAADGPEALGTVDAEYSLFGDSTDLTLIGTGNLLDVDPELGPLADNGGATPTHRPEIGSPVLEAGNPAIAGAPTYDQRGTDRIVGTIDIGAVELQEEERPVWIPIEPARLYESRAGETTVDGLFEGGGQLASESQVEFDVAGRAGIPGDAVAVIVNMTAVSPSSNGFAVAHACLPQRPTAAGLNYTTGVNLGNEVIAGLDGDGSMCIFVKSATHLTVDAVGYVPGSSAYQAVDPARLLETRAGRPTIDGLFEGAGQPGAEQQIEIDIAGRGGVDADAEAAVLYVAAVNALANGFITLYDCEGDRPNASSLNHVPGVNRGNEVVVRLSDAGTVCIFTKQAIDVTVDVVGFLPDGTDYHGLDEPTRVLETRPGLTTGDGLFAGGGTLDAGQVLELDLAGRVGIDDDARTVVMNITAIQAPLNGFVTVYQCGPRPKASSLNYVAGVNGGNELVAGLSDDGTLCIYSLRTIHLTVDVSGYTAPDVVIDENVKVA